VSTAVSLTQQRRDLVVQHENLCFRGDVATREGRQPVEHAHHEQIDETDKHERRSTGQSGLAAIHHDTYNHGC
jgi:hypothetical protein